MSQLSDQNAVATASLTPSPVLFWLKVDLRLSEKGINGRQPNTILGLIPAGYKNVSFALRQVSSVAVETKISPAKIILGLLVFFAGWSLFGSSVILGFVLLLAGAGIFVSGLTAALAVSNNGGMTQYIKVSLLEKAKLEEFAATVQAAVLDIN